MFQFIDPLGLIDLFWALAGTAPVSMQLFVLMLLVCLWTICVAGFARRLILFVDCQIAQINRRKGMQPGQVQMVLGGLVNKLIRIAFTFCLFLVALALVESNAPFLRSENFDGRFDWLIELAQSTRRWYLG